VLDGLKPSQRKVLFACFKREGASARRNSPTAAARDGRDANTSDSIESENGGSSSDESGVTNAAIEIDAAASAVDAKPSGMTGAVRQLPAAGSEVKVAQLAGYVAEHTAYHHGEASLVATIVGMAQDFPGSNNVPLLQPLGQFGTRLQARVG
jgi:hypothetical protein